MSAKTETKPAVSEVTEVTPYKAAAIVNGVLEAAGIDKVIPPQMMYNYTIGRIKKGKAPVGGLVTVEKDGKVLITVASLEAWTTAYVVKNASA